MEHEMSQFTITPIAPLAAAKYVYTAPVREPTDHMPLLSLDDLPSNIFWDVLGRALTNKRDNGSASEAQFVAYLTTRLPVTMIDAAGNLHVDTRTDATHRSMFTSHTDTVHSTGGKNNVRVDGRFWRADVGAALGADDGSGCALLAYMIEQGVPGYYVFFRGEERGGIGSKWLSEEMPDLFVGSFDRAVAFDRAGYYDIITHQAGGRCCSEEFAEALGTALSTDDNWMVPCNGGVYTDTAEFTTLIPECTNVSVGYKNQHGDREEQDVEFLWELAKGVVSFDWDALPTVRDPSAKPESRYSRYSDINAEWADYYDNINAGTNSDGVYRGTKLTAYDEDDEDDAETQALNAIEAFRDSSDPQWLLDLTAEAAYPDDAAQALRLINTNLMTEEVIQSIEDMLYNGWGADQALLELFNLVGN